MYEPLCICVWWSRGECYWSRRSHKYQWAVLLVIDSLTLDPVTAGRYGLTHLRYGTQNCLEAIRSSPGPNQTESETGHRERFTELSDSEKNLINTHTLSLSLSRSLSHTRTHAHTHTFFLSGVYRFLQKISSYVCKCPEDAETWCCGAVMQPSWSTLWPFTPASRTDASFLTFFQLCSRLKRLLTLGT